jgi:hypothetical protein
MERRAADTRRPPIGTLVTAALVMGAGFALSLMDPAATRAAQISLAVTDDDSGRALFGDVQLAPGHSVSRCLRIAASSADRAATVRFGATDVTGTLATGLRLRVEAGDGAWFGDCSGFTAGVATPVFDGTLADLAAAPQGVDTRWLPATVPQRSFRITAALAPGVTEQGRLASGSFVWRLSEAASAPVPGVTDAPSAPPPTDPGGPSITVTPAPGPGAGPVVPSPGGRPVESPSVSPTAGPLGPERRLDAGHRDDREEAADQGGGELPVDLTLDHRLARLGEVSRAAVRTAAAIVAAPEYPLSALALALFFLAVQDRIDRRDPKLARASGRQHELEVVFPDRFVRAR